MWEARNLTFQFLKKTSQELLCKGLFTVWKPQSVLFVVTGAWATCVLSRLTMMSGCELQSRKGLRYSSCPRVRAWFTMKLCSYPCRFTDDITKSTSKTGQNGSAVYFLGRFYDNLFVRRKGVTSLSWPKPKLKFKLSDNVRDSLSLFSPEYALEFCPDTLCDSSSVACEFVHYLLFTAIDFLFRYDSTGCLPYSYWLWVRCGWDVPFLW